MKMKNLFKRSLHSKLILPVIVTMAVSLMINLVLFGRIDRTIKRMNQVYATNIRLSELERILTGMENGLYEYLNVQNQDSLEQFQENRSQFADVIEGIDDRITDHPGVLKTAMEQAKSTNGEAVKDALKTLDIRESFPGGEEIILPYDRICFEDHEIEGTWHYHDNISASVAIAQIQDGEYKTVWPFEYAKEKIQYPARYSR